jgi:hypothetical protein
MQNIYTDCLKYQLQSLIIKKMKVDEKYKILIDEKEKVLKELNLDDKEIKKLTDSLVSSRDAEIKLISPDADSLRVSYKPLLEYVYTYYYEISRGNYYKYKFESDDFEIIDKKDFGNEVIAKLDKKLLTGEFEKNNRIFSIVSRLDKARVYSLNGIYYINECKGFLHKNPRPFDTFSDDVKNRFKIMMDFIKEVKCNNDDAFFHAYVLYLSQLCKGQKTEVLLYNKGEQGGGKSTELDFIINFVLGKDICLISGTEPLTSNFNKIFMGKLLILFEELPTFTTSAWAGVSSKLKTLTTESLTVYRDLFEKPIQAENISNFIINTNVEAIKDSDGRRIIIAPINNSRIGDYDYFENIRSKCFNLEVGECFFSYMLEQDTSKFYAQRCFPETDLKRIARAELLQSYEKFLKDEFVLKHVGIDKVKPSDLHTMYKLYCLEINKKPLTKNDFIKKLELLNIHYTKIGTNFYKISYETLKDISDKRKWLCQYDIDLTDKNDNDIEEDFIDDPLDGKQPNKEYYERKIARLEALLKIARSNKNEIEE